MLQSPQWASSTVLASDANDFTVASRVEGSRRDVFFVFLCFPLPTVRIRFSPEFEPAPSTQPQIDNNMPRPTQRVCTLFPKPRGQWTRSFISGFNSLLSYLFGWLRTLYPTVTSICEGPLRITGCLLVSIYKTGRGALCACVHLARNNTIPWGVQFDTGSRAKASELCGVVTERWCTERGRQRNS